MIVQDPGEFCLQFAGTAASESYLFGVQSVTEVASSRTPVTVASVIAPGAVAAPPAAALLAPRPLGLARSAEAARRMELLRRHRVAETRILAQGLELLEGRRASVPRASAPAQVPQDVQVGDTVSIRVPIGGSLSCDSYEEIKTVAREVGTRAVWLEDVANPTGGYTTADFQVFDNQFENDTYDVDVAYFGTPSDIDANGHVVIVVTQEVNKLEGPAGFVAPLDFLTRAECAASDEGEIIYVWAPDPDGVASGFALALIDARYIAATLSAHEFVHIIQVGRRVQAGSTLPTIWELEGQASLGEEVVGHGVEGNALWQDLGAEMALNIGFSQESDWYFYAFLDLLTYTGADLTIAPPLRIENAPEDCTWLGRDAGHVCAFDLVNGVPWSFLRWLSDHFGPGFAGGEQELQRNLIDNTLAGFANIESIIGVSIDTLLAQWAAMLYLDNRILADGTPVVADSILGLRTWNLYDVFENVVFDGVNVHRLLPRNRAFDQFSDQTIVRAASSAYFIVSGNGRVATAIRARDANDDPLPQHMQVWVVRMR
jgi:hypothetical protein